jgi:hypothetical protein
MVIYADTLPPEVSVIKVPEIRIRRQNGRPVQPDGEFVLNWMIAARKVRVKHFIRQYAGGS